jgi:hypothetical protein
MKESLEEVVVEVKKILDEEKNKVVEVRATSEKDMNYIKKFLKDYDIVGITSISTDGPKNRDYVLHVRNYLGGNQNA